MMKSKILGLIYGCIDGLKRFRKYSSLLPWPLRMVRVMIESYFDLKGDVMVLVVPPLNAVYAISFVSVLGVVKKRIFLVLLNALVMLVCMNLSYVPGVGCRLRVVTNLSITLGACPQCLPSDMNRGMNLGTGSNFAQNPLFL